MLSRQLHWVFDMQLGRCGLVGPRVAYQAEKMNNIFKNMGEKKKHLPYFLVIVTLSHAKLMGDSHLSLKKLIEIDRLNSLR